MSKIVDRVGEKYNRLTVIRLTGVVNHKSYWECLCDCGMICVLPGNSLQTGATRSCGCLRKEQDLAGRIPADVRFWAKVNKCGPVPKHRPELGPCWEWTASRRGGGYGQFVVGAGQIKDAHRWVWEQCVGEIPPGLFVLHACDNKGCVNYLSHLFVGTQADNIQDMLNKHRQNPPRGERSNRTPITEWDVRRIRERALHGETFEVIAMDFPVQAQCIGRIVNRKRWGHLP